jgi:CNT family concentrative nucleoside transporter
VAGWLFSPIAWCMGVPWAEATTVGSLLGIKAILNEFVAFIALSGLEPGVLSERSVLIATYALGGFANFGSVGVVLGGVGTMVPERRADLSALAPRALLAATLGNCMSGAIVALVG